MVRITLFALEVMRFIVNEFVVKVMLTCLSDLKAWHIPFLTNCIVMSGKNYSIWWL